MDTLEKEWQLAERRRLQTWDTAIATLVISGFLLLCVLATHDPARLPDRDTVRFSFSCRWESWRHGNALEDYQRFKKDRLDELQKRVDNELPGYVIVPLEERKH